MKKEKPSQDQSILKRHILFGKEGISKEEVITSANKFLAQMRKKLLDGLKGREHR